VYGDGKQTRCFAYVGDIVPALITLMERRDLVGEIFNLGSTTPITIEELAQRIISKTQSRSKILHIPYEAAYGPGYDDMLHRQPSIEKAKKAIGFEPKTSLDEILDAVIADMRKRLGEMPQP